MRSHVRLSVVRADFTVSSCCAGGTSAMQAGPAAEALVRLKGRCSCLSHH